MKSSFNFSVILLLLFIGVSCSNDDNNGSTPTPTPVITTFMATLAPETGVISTASGNATLIVNETAKTYEITVTYTAGLAPIHGHIHRSDGDVEIGFPDAKVVTSPFKVSGSITDAQITGLKTGTYYVNLHTEAYLAGEIRGNLTKTGSTGGGGGGGGGGGTY